MGTGWRGPGEERWRAGRGCTALRRGAGTSQWPLLLSTDRKSRTGAVEELPLGWGERTWESSRLPALRGCWPGSAGTSAEGGEQVSTLQHVSHVEVEQLLRQQLGIGCPPQVSAPLPHYKALGEKAQVAAEVQVEQPDFRWGPPRWSARMAGGCLLQFYHLQLNFELMFSLNYLS